ncbi:hypothetical protein L9F63_008284, partial [Diploptera punctata]
MSLSSSSPYKGLDRAFCIRMKSTLTKRGCHFKSSGYRVVLVLCRLRPQYTFSHTRKSSTPPLLGMVAIAMALPPPSVHEIRLESDMFVTRINFDFRIAHCEPRVSDLLDYSAEELTGKNLYALCHGEDANKLRKSHIDLINKGQVMTQYYRIMNKNGGYTWMQTCATVVCNSKNAEEQNIICVNYVISGREYENLIMDCCQMEDNVQTVKREEAGGNDPENGSPDADRGSRNSGGPPNQPQDPHRSPPDLEDGSSEGPGDHGGRGGRGHLDHVTQLQATSAQLTSQGTPTGVDHNQLAGGLSIRALKKMTTVEKETRRGQKRKLGADEDSSCCSSDDEDDEDEEPTTARGKGLLHQQTHRSAVLSPASSSCHSSTTSSCVPAPPLVLPADSPKQPVQHDDSDGGARLSQHDLPLGQPIENRSLPGGGTSVKDLEHAMSKHLPAVTLGKGTTSTPPPLSLQQHQPTDFSTDALLKQQQQRSTIQWIGAHHHLNHLNHHQQLQHSQGSSAPLPASALLRQLYANRESVIRANVHAAATGIGSTGRGGGPTSYYAGDVNQVGPLPTPPGSEGSSTYGDHQFVLAHNQKSTTGVVNGGADAFSSLVSSYSTTGGYSVDYHSAMTPPSSVSPRDKHQQQIHGGGAFDSPVYSDVLRHQYLGGTGGAGTAGADGTPAQPLPLKPQVYSAVHPSALDAAAAYAATTSLDQSQFYHHSTAGAGFHLYHPTANKT